MKFPDTQAQILSISPRASRNAMRQSKPMFLYETGET